MQFHLTHRSIGTTELLAGTLAEPYCCFQLPAAIK
jgi:hypothetical protein